MRTSALETTNEVWHACDHGAIHTSNQILVLELYLELIPFVSFHALYSEASPHKALRGLALHSHDLACTRIAYLQLWCATASLTQDRHACWDCRWEGRTHLGTAEHHGLPAPQRPQRQFWLAAHAAQPGPASRPGRGYPGWPPSSAPRLTAAWWTAQQHIPLLCTPAPQGLV